MGRPHTFDPRLADIASRLRKLGLTSGEIQFAIGISDSTYWRWRRELKIFKKSSSLPKGAKKPRRNNRCAP
jgi:hypothetical protein